MEYVIAVVALIFVWLVVMYNKLIRDKNRVFQAWSDISVQLKRRHDLIPKLVAAVDAYAHYEKSTLEEMTQLRVKADSLELPTQKAEAEAALTGNIRQLLAVAEAYPDLKANHQYLDLMQQLTAVENQIQYARRYYNGSVKNLNVRIESFPDLILANAFKFKSAEFFELDSATSAT